MKNYPLFISLCAFQIIGLPCSHLYAQKERAYVNTVEGGVVKMTNQSHNNVEAEDTLFYSDILSIAKDGFVSLELLKDNGTKYNRYDCEGEKQLSVSEIIKLRFLRLQKPQCAAIKETKSPSKVYSQKCPIPNESINPGIFTISFYDEKGATIRNYANEGSSITYRIVNNTERLLYLEMIYVDKPGKNASLFTEISNGILSPTAEQDWVVVAPKSHTDSRFFLTPQVPSTLKIIALASYTPIMFEGNLILQYYSGNKDEIEPLYSQISTFIIE